MSTEFKWLSDNLSNRILDKNSDFDITIKFDTYKKYDFENASEIVCNKLYERNRKLFVGLSGGIDSEYVFKKFISIDIPITPVIVDVASQKKETKIAFDLCKKYDINPVVLSISQNVFYTKFYSEIFLKINGIGIDSAVPFFVAEYAKQNKGLYIKAEHCIGENEIELNEWDFYCDLYYDNVFDFFLYTPEIVYSISILLDGRSSQEFKCELFNIEYRDKIKPTHSEFVKILYRRARSDMKFNPKYYWKMNPKDFIQKYF